MASIELDGVVFTPRKWTNAVRATVQKELDERARIEREAARCAFEFQRLQSLAEKGETDEADSDKVADTLVKMGELDRELEGLFYRVAPKVLRDPDGTPPTKKLLDEHATPSDLIQVVTVGLGGDEPDPTQARKGNS